MIISINDRPEVREIFAGLHQKRVETTYHIQTRTTGAGKIAGELIVSNFALPGEEISAAA